MKGKKVPPARMVTHTWSNLFSHLVAAVIADALELPDFDSVVQRLKHNELKALESELWWKGKLDMTYWICAFCVNQHAGICGFVPPMDADPITKNIPPACTCAHAKYWSSTPPLNDGQSVHCEMNKFDDMMACLASVDPNFGQLIAVDPGFNLFTRAWCVAEIHRAHSMHLRQKMNIFAQENLKQHDEFLKGLKVEEMRASNPDDTALILSRIDDKAAFDSEVQKMIFGTDGLLQTCLGGFQKVKRLGEIAKQGYQRQGAKKLTSTSMTDDIEVGPQTTGSSHYRQTTSGSDGSAAAQSSAPSEESNRASAEPPELQPTASWFGFPMP